MWSPHLIQLVLNISNSLKVQIIYSGQLLLHQIHLVVIRANFRRWVVLKVHDGVTGRVVAINNDLLVLRLLYNLQLSLVLILSHQLFRICFWLGRRWLLFFTFRRLHLFLSLREVKREYQFWRRALLLIIGRRSSVRRRFRGWGAAAWIAIAWRNLRTTRVITVFEGAFGTLLSFNFHDFVVEPLIFKLFDLFLRELRHFLLFLKFYVLLSDVFDDLLLNQFSEGHIIVLTNLVYRCFDLTRWSKRHLFLENLYWLV